MAVLYQYNDPGLFAQITLEERSRLGACQRLRLVEEDGRLIRSHFRPSFYGFTS
jgi:hypothetical protein